VLEVTESVFDARYADEIVDSLARVRALGALVHIDDFGSGYSSFARLLDMPVDCLKIDQTLIRTMTTDARSFLVIRAILDLSRALGLTATAEGVENVEVINQLRELNCDLAQGYAIARPMPATDATRWLAERPAGVPFAMESAR
jgi:EAL domain-containing protein (putative c-di-GMP-specific phosphodiesterase class I)